MAEDHGAPEAGKLPRVWTRGRKEIESRQRVSGAESVAGQWQNKMRGVLRRVSTGSAGGILGSANPREIRT